MAQKALKQVRIMEGRRISTLAEIERFIEGVGQAKTRPMFIGNASNVPAYLNDSDLYSKDEVYSKTPLYINPAGLNKVNLFIGPQGSGKSVFVEQFVHNHPNHQMLIFDAKREWMKWAYDPERDILVSLPDSRGACWDVIGEIINNPSLQRTIWKTMLQTVRGKGNNNDQQWDTYAMPYLFRLVDLIQKSDLPREEWYITIAAAYKTFKEESTGEMDQSGLGTAIPVISMIFKLYYVGGCESRQWFSISELEKYRRIFVPDYPLYSESVSMLNNALISMLSNKVMSRDDLTEADYEKDWFFIFEEFLTLKINDEILDDLTTKCRSKRVNLFFLIQTIEKESEKLKEKLGKLKASRAIIVSFGTGDDETAKTISEMSESLIYRKRENQETDSQHGILGFINPGSGENENWVERKVRQIPSELMMSLPKFVGYLHIMGQDQGQIKTFVAAPYINAPKIHKDYIESDFFTHAPEMEVLIHE